MKSSFFSIVITAYNSEKYIKQCIFSVLNQNFREYELIIVDDGSNDNTLKILKNIHDNRINIIHLPQNTGVSNARNTALMDCSGRYIFFLDADDYIKDGFLKEAYEELMRTDADVLFCPYFVFWENKRKFKYANPCYRLNSIKKLPKPFTKKDAKKILYEANYELCTKFYKKDFLINNDITFEILPFGEDLPFYWEVLSKAQNFSYIKKQYYCYRKGHKKLNIPFIVKYLPLAVVHSKKYNLTVEDIFYDKISKMLNYWIVKTDFNSELYEFARHFCPPNKILNINSLIVRLKSRINLFLFGKI